MRCAISFKILLSMPIRPEKELNSRFSIEIEITSVGSYTLHFTEGMLCRNQQRHWEGFAIKNAAEIYSLNLYTLPFPGGALQSNSDRRHLFCRKVNNFPKSFWITNIHIVEIVFEELMFNSSYFPLTIFFFNSESRVMKHRGYIS